MNSADWPHPQQIWEKGNCRGAADPDIFYPERDATTYPGVSARAKAICHGQAGAPCPVLLECLFFGLVTEDRFGIWGGMSPRERNALRRIGSLDRYRPTKMMEDQPHYALIEEYLGRNGRIKDEENEEEGPTDEQDI